MKIKEITDKLYEISRFCKNLGEEELSQILDKINIYYLTEESFDELNDLLDDFLCIDDISEKINEESTFHVDDFNISTLSETNSKYLN